MVEHLKTLQPLGVSPAKLTYLFEPAHEKLAVCTPFTNRETHFPHWLKGIRDYLKSQNIQDYQLVAVKQTDDTIFNLSIARNIGITYAFDTLWCDYVASVDVDIIPVRNVDYRWRGFNEVRFTSMGSVKVDKNSFQKANGYNYLFNGWGHEDSEFETRLDHIGVPFVKWERDAGSAAIVIDLEAAEGTMEEHKKRSMLYWGVSQNPIDVATIVGPSPSVPRVDKSKWYLRPLRDANAVLGTVFRLLPSDRKDTWIRKYGASHLFLDRIKAERVADDLTIIEYSISDVYNSEPEWWHG